MRLVTAACTLRPFVATDAPALAHHANDRAVWRTVRDRFPHPYTLADAEAFIGMVTSRDEPVPTTFAIEVEGGVVGGVGLIPGTDIERIGAEIGYWLGRAWWGRGIASHAVAATTAYAFGPLGFLRVFAMTMAGNTASRRVLARCGYTLEGILRSAQIKEGIVHDTALYAAIRDDWIPPTFAASVR